MKGFTHARLGCGCRVSFREGVEPSPIIVVRLSTNTDIGVFAATSPISASEIATASTPIRSGSTAATSAPKARTRMTSVSGSSAVSSRRTSAALVFRTSRSSGERPVTQVE